MVDYTKKVVTADEAVRQAVHDGDMIIMAHAAGAPKPLVEALAANYKQFHDVKIFHLVTLGETPYCAPEMEGHFRLMAGFLGGNTRPCVEAHRGDFIPVFFHRLPFYLREGLIPCDVAFIQVSKPNEAGMCSFGISCDYTKPAAEKARVVVAEMNEQMPFIEGDNFINVKDIDYIVESDRPLYELPNPKIGEVEMAIGKNVAALVNDGATLQLGIGSIPDAVLSFLGEKNDLGLHTEMFSDGAVPLIEKGVMNGKYKQIDNGLHTATFLMGTKRLYDFANHNDSVKMAPVDYVNNPAVIGKLDNLISINSCIEVDLQGQVNSESMGLRQFSGVGGQVDYVRGAAISKGGKSIMAIPSTARKGTVSRIVANFAPGTAVTTSRNDVDYIVTEYGTARLMGLSLRERAKALIGIAHPQFRDELEEEWKKRFN